MFIACLLDGGLTAPGGPTTTAFSLRQELIACRIPLLVFPRSSWHRRRVRDSAQVVDDCVPRPDASGTLIGEVISSPEVRSLAQRYPGVQVVTVLQDGLHPVRCSESHGTKSLVNLVNNAAEAIEDVGTVTIATRNTYVDPSRVRVATTPPSRRTAA